MHCTVDYRFHGYAIAVTMFFLDEPETKLVMRSIPYSGKFLWGLIFVIFVDKWLSAKISTTVQCIMGMIAFVRKKENWPSAKIGPHENFPLYSITKKINTTFTLLHKDLT
jgi:hypothetical protein